MDAESGDDDKDGLTSGWGSESRGDGKLTEWIWKLYKHSIILTGTITSGAIASGLW